ncbi:nucleotidyltransferase family protein [Rufibacter quisquiliarum]|uniref:NDP-sugar pyrophosphorylase family protein n=1 Tax=Rufibacter quisquiliarum TaxID=1549639 RepID=A0A839GNG5_9BACT|nr:sugar phosphate nucleotidyltransferase [Rufibacter quisquiliarum]MBA9079483.1 NDP-sugar pyrophosphorylase family protein [Rufibacter quisquiliarum]
MEVKPTLVVLAAGMASRYGSLKQIDGFGPNGETIIDYSIYDAVRAGFGKVIFIIRKSIEEEFRAVMLNKFSDKIAVEYVLQELAVLPDGLTVPENRVKPWGTAHAVWVAREKLQEPFAVINGDDFYGAKSFQIIADFLRSGQPCGLVGYQLANTLSEHGAVSRGICEVDADGTLRSITEQTHIERKEQHIVAIRADGEEIPLAPDQIVSMNLMGFSPSLLPYFEQYLKEFINEQGHQPKAEFYLPSVVDRLVKAGVVKVNVLPTPEKWFGVTYPADKPVATKSLGQLVAQGVYPKNLWNRSLETVE